MPDPQTVITQQFRQGVQSECHLLEIGTHERVLASGPKPLKGFDTAFCMRFSCKSKEWKTFFCSWSVQAYWRSGVTWHQCEGNQNSVLDNPSLVDKIMNKEEKHSHVVTLHDWACILGPNFRHSSQGIVDMKRQIWDSSTIRHPSDLVLDDQTPIDEEAEVTFGTVKYGFYWLIYNLRVRYPEAPIYLSLAGVKACFRFPRIHPDLTGAFGFLTNNFFCLAVAIVFGFNTSSTCWEPFRRAIEGLTLKSVNM